MSLVETTDSSLTEADARSLLDSMKKTQDIFVGQIKRAWANRIWAALGYETWAEMAEAEDLYAAWRSIDDRREIVVALTAEGMSNRAIAAVAGVDEKTVRNDKAGAEYSAPDKDREGSDDREESVGGVGDPAPATSVNNPSLEPTGAPSPSAPNPAESFKPKPVYPSADADADAPDASEPEPAKVTGTDGKQYPATKPKARKSPRRPVGEVAHGIAQDIAKITDRVESVINDDRPKNDDDLIPIRNQVARLTEALQRLGINPLAEMEIQ